ADGHGHGTHVASTIAGSGAASGGQYQGVAPGADLAVGKVRADGGGWPTAAAIAGMEAAAQEPGADTVSTSLGRAPPDCLSDGTDPMSQAVNTLTAATGALFVIAAGNSGGPSRRVATPGVADAALTVGASAKRAEDWPLPIFTSLGPRIDGVLKPDISA